jgi:hypothetical protein
MPFQYNTLSLKGLTLFVFYGNTFHTSESVSGSGTSWTLSNTPVSQRGFRLIGTGVYGSGFCLNYTLDPITGDLTTSGSYSSLLANYYSYSGSGQFLIEPSSFQPKSTTPNQRTDIWNGHHINLPNYKPAMLSFNIIRTQPSETVLNYVAEMVIRANWFIVMDGRSGKAYEGNVISDRVFSVDKGDEPFIPFQMFVEYFGSFDIDGNSGSGAIDWKAYDN